MTVCGQLNTNKTAALVRHRVKRVVFAEPVPVGESPGPPLGLAIGPTGGHKELRSEVCVETVGALMAKANSDGALRSEKNGKNSSVIIANQY